MVIREERAWDAVVVVHYHNNRHHQATRLRRRRHRIPQAYSSGHPALAAGPAAPAPSFAEVRPKVDRLEEVLPKGLLVAECPVAILEEVPLEVPEVLECPIVVEAVRTHQNQREGQGQGRAALVVVHHSSLHWLRRSWNNTGGQETQALDDSSGTSPERALVVVAVVAVVAVDIDIHPIDLVVEGVGHQREVHNPDILPILLVREGGQKADPNRGDQPEPEAGCSLHNQHMSFHNSRDLGRRVLPYNSCTSFGRSQ